VAGKKSVDGLHDRMQWQKQTADNNTTTNQRRDQQKWAVVVMVIATGTATATMATRQRDGDPTALVMDGDGWCDGNATVRTAMEGTTATQRQHDGN
jgi:hypothetical protein